MSDVINPTRMELTKLKERLVVTKRGHKLLKDKQDEFIQRFIDMIKDYKQLRSSVEEHIAKMIYFYKKTITTMNQSDLTDMLKTMTQNTSLEFGMQNMMGLKIPSLKLELENTVDFEYDFHQTPAAFDELINLAKSILPEIIKLVEVETKVEMMIHEIEKSKRRVNAIDSIVIKEIEQQIKVIRMKLSDIERSNTIRMIKSKEIITNKSEVK